jgi:hypothetical protein
MSNEACCEPDPNYGAIWPVSPSPIEKSADPHRVKRYIASKDMATKQNKHWASSDEGTTFTPREEEVIYESLPPALYNMQMTPQGFFFIKNNEYNTNDLIKFNEGSLNLIVSEIQKFWTKKELFKKNQIPFKRGMLLYGPPGAGKTCALKLIINDVIAMGGLAIIYENSSIFQLGMQILRGIQPETPVVVIMEDVDSIASYDEIGLINMLDGFSVIENAVFLATTNNINHISDRVKNRPSRFDKRIFIGPPDLETRKTYLHKLVDGSGFTVDIDKWAADTEDMSFAHIKELYLSVCFFDTIYDVALNRLRGMVPKKGSYDLREDGVGGDMFFVPVMRGSMPKVDSDKIDIDELIYSATKDNRKKN